jgi:hypothetical protein
MVYSSTAMFLPYLLTYGAEPRSDSNPTFNGVGHQNRKRDNPENNKPDRIK